MKMKSGSVVIEFESRSRLTWPECFLAISVCWMVFALVSVVLHAQLTGQTRYLDQLVEVSFNGLMHIVQFFN